MSTPLIDDCRKAFDEWAVGKEEDLYGLEWMAWQAAWKISGDRPCPHDLARDFK